VAIIDNGRLIFSKGFGSAQLEYRVPVTDETTFHVASVSKQFTAMAIMLLEADGALSLDDEVQKYIPWVPLFDHPVTVRQLVNHTSGIRDQWELLYMAGWRLDDVITMHDIRTMMKRQTELNFVPQSDILYSNMAYTLMAEIVAAVSEKSFPDFTRERIFEPLGMKHTHFHLDHEEIDPGRSYSYEQDKNGQLKKSVLSFANVGATGLSSTPKDLVLWLDNFRTHRIGNDRVFTNMLTIPKLSNGKLAALYGSGYAGGLMLGKYRGLKTIGHSGGDAGFRANVQWFPEHSLGIAVATNLASGDPAGHLHKVADVVLKSHFSEALPEQSETETPVDLTRDILERYTGIFQIQDRGLIDLSIVDNNLEIDISGIGVFKLEPLSETTFLIDELQIRLNFATVEGDSYGNIEIKTGNGEMSASKLVSAQLSPATLMNYSGTYYSPELRTQWDIIHTDGGLLVRHFRHGDVKLLAIPVANQDTKPVEFLGDRWFATKIVIDVDQNGSAKGFRVTGGRVRDLWFQKL